MEMLLTTENQSTLSEYPRQIDCDGDSVLDLTMASHQMMLSLFYSLSEKLIILLFYPIMMVFGLVANIAFLLVVTRIAEMRTLTNYYLANLAIADLLFITSVGYHFCVSYLASPDVKLLLYHSSAGCVINVSIQFMSHFASIAIVFLVTLERYLGICKPFHHRVVATKGRTIMLITLAWTFGMVYSCGLISPKWYQFSRICVIWPDGEKYKQYPTTLTTCVPIHSFYQFIPDIVQTFPYIVTLIFTITMYVRIIVHLRSRDLQFDNTNPQATDNTRRSQSSSIARLLIANGVVFFIGYAPYYINRLNDAIVVISNNRFGFQLTTSQRGAWDWSAIALSIINSIINPVIYSISSPRYRQAFMQVFKCNVGAQKGQTSSQTSVSNISNKLKDIA